MEAVRHSSTGQIRLARPSGVTAGPVVVVTAHDLTTTLGTTKTLHRRAQQTPAVEAVVVREPPTMAGTISLEQGVVES